MKTLIEVVDSTIEHVRLLSVFMREKDRMEAIRQGSTPHRLLYKTYKAGTYRKTILVDGWVAAMFGLTGNLIAGQTGVYFVTGYPVEEISSIRFARTYIRELNKMLQISPRLFCCVDSKYHEAMRLLEIAGFKKETVLNLNDNEFFLYKIGDV